MNELDRISLLLTDLPVYLANGVLVILYWLAAHMPALTSLLCALLMAWLPDAEIQQRAGFRPRRSERGSSGDSGGKMPRTAQVMTGMVLAAWIIAQWDMGAPVPWIGAAMWVAGLAAILALSAQRFNLLWYVKAGIAMYALAVIGSRIYLGYTAGLTPEQWAALIGSSESAAVVIANTRSNVTTILLWALWLIVPLGYFSMLVQQIFINPMSMVNPLAGAQDMLRALRVRDSR
ncbi:hypothetical protein BECAL_01138 [Bellilinea caldifistulae]|uniref:Uncharacterized protein n=1 Tax=Bellilinea caldifistulae TaxID=360411 RepID=A0A0P6XDE7_9CHLR|nr:hypothetical protein [Bellilinea caldifistulae]KPL77758.1 hypothetical protein AC812_02615 [Bellilinea caldifistulae]GAP09984.1 hypothetical protein BECAL_01138 [Bellilinea caldifistulae]